MTDDLDAAVHIRVLGGVRDIDAATWDRAAAPETQDGGRARHPFVTHRFLASFEDSGSAVPETGWGPRHLVAETADGRLIGVAPAYLKGHSQGEYVFDHGWADAYERAGGRYYPKLQLCAPFTPVPGPRFLVVPDGPLAPKDARAVLASGAAQYAEQNRLSSFHATFCTEEEWLELGEVGLLRRQNQQFHWRNDGYDSFDDFLNALASRKRKQLRKERAQAVCGGVSIHWLTGTAIQPEHWDAFWRFYIDTGARKWGQPYLTREWFEIAHERLRDDILLVMAQRDGCWIAGTLNVIGRETLFGRYWGCVEDHPCLHFELCYYQAIDFAIAHGLATVEAGAQGGHKLVRGYEPIPTYSLHWIRDDGFRDAVANYLERERAAVDAEIAMMDEMTPFKKG